MSQVQREQAADRGRVFGAKERGRAHRRAGLVERLVLEERGAMTRENEAQVVRAGGADGAEKSVAASSPDERMAPQSGRSPRR